MMTPDASPRTTASHEQAPAFPHHAAPAQTPLEAAQRQYAERPAGVPNWQPDDGDFT